MTDVPGQDRWDSIRHRRFSDHSIIEARPDPAIGGVAAHRVERLRWRKADQLGDGSQTLQRRPGLLCREPERRVRAATG